MKIHKVIILLLSLMLNFVMADAQSYWPQKKGKKFLFYNSRTDEVVFKTKFQDARRFNDGLAAVKLKGKWGYLNKQFEYVIPCQFDSAKDFKNGFAIVSNNKGDHLINKLGEVVSGYYEKIKYQRVMFVVEVDGKFGLIDGGGKLVSDPIFDEIGVTYKKIITVKKDNEWGAWKDNEFLKSNKLMYFLKPDEMPLFRKECESHMEMDKRIDCSNDHLLKLVNENLKYPPIAKANNIEGTVVIRFVVNYKGEVEAAEIVRDVGAGLGKEALSIVTNYLNKWEVPGKQDKVNVNTIYNYRIKFKLEKN